MRPAPDFRFPSPERGPRRRGLALGASLLAHVGLVVLVSVGARSFTDQGRVEHVLLFAPPTGTVREATLPEWSGGGGRPRLLLPDPGRRGRGAPAAPARVALPLRDSAGRAGPVPRAPRAAAPAAEGRGARRLPPALASGQLWVRPLPAAPRELAQRLQRSHEEMADSAVTAVVQAYLDSVAHEPGADGVELPAWTTELGGRKFGLDEKYIYVAGLKIPAVVLALLPFPAAGNPDQNRAYSHLMDIRRDIYQAAQRADNTAEFKKYVREIRERKERERQFREAQRQPPDSTPAAPVP